MEYAELEAAVEAILFASGRAVSEEDLGRALGISKEEAGSVAASMAARWADEPRGTEIIELEGSWQMCTKKEYYPQLITLELNPKTPRLTDVQMETLSVIAYKQPVTKAEIERIRGVNSDHAVNKLIEYHLVTELGRAKQPGRPILFGTTQDFLRVFGVKSSEDLPEISPVKVADFRAEAESEAGAGRDDGREAAESSDEHLDPEANEHAGTPDMDGSESGALPEIDRGEQDHMDTIGI